MGIKAFILKYDAEANVFTNLFLASPDFDSDTLKAIVKRLGDAPSNKPKNELVDMITARMGGTNMHRVSKIIMEQLTARRRGWLSVKTGHVPNFPDAADPSELVFSTGTQQWYGPLTSPVDKVEARWYVRPVFVDHIEIDEHTKQPQKYPIRWLCFARLTTNTISLHWKGFSYTTPGERTSGQNLQFPYWKYVPTLFDEISDLSGATVTDIQLHDLVLYHLWDEYLKNEQYEWLHRRIRAEAGGVALSAHAGGVIEIDMADPDTKRTGILHLASTVRKAIEKELLTTYKYELPDPDRFDDVVLMTFIRGYGSLSYEFSLTSGGHPIFRAHSYFGFKPLSNSADSFPHLHLFVSKRHDLELLDFILEHCNKMPQNNQNNSHDENTELKGLPLFQNQ